MPMSLPCTLSKVPNSPMILLNLLLSKVLTQLAQFSFPLHFQHLTLVVLLILLPLLSDFFFLEPLHSFSLRKLFCFLIQDDFHNHLMLLVVIQLMAIHMLGKLQIHSPGGRRSELFLG